MIVITSHQKPDFDAVASMVAVQKLFPDSIVVIAGVPEENVAKFLNAFPQVFSFQSDDSFNPFDIDNAIVVDTQCLPSTGKFIELIQSDAYELHVYDHHPLKKHSGKKPAVFVHENVGATVTILIKRLIAEGINIRPEEATLMLLAIYEETGSFRYVSSTPDDLEAAAALLRFGADIALVADYFSQQLDLEHTRVLSQLLDSLEYIQIQSIKIYFVTASLNYFLPNVSFLLHKIRELENIGILFSFIEMAGKVYFIARSNHQFIDVGAIAEYFGGGGHPTAASAVLRDKPLAQIKDEVIAYLNAAVKKEYTASDIMSYPVKFITEDTSVEHAKQTMVKANFNTLPVLKQGKLAGIVTRKDLDKALFHQFANSPVKLYMNTDVVTIKSDTPLSEIREKFRENNIGRLPVVDEDVLRGIITRTDLFRILHDDYLSDRGGLRETSFRQYPFSKISHKQFDKVLPKEILSLLQTIGTLADDYGFQAYVVGGFVRDVLLGYKNFDIDIVVERDGIAFAQIIANHFSARYVVHQKFATAVVALPDGLHIDIATARLEYYASPGALPTIELASIKQDLARRDFSINAMAIKINASEFGSLIDFFNGQQDAKNKIIRVLHNLSFIEDPTRIFRAIRLEQRFGFHMDKNTENLIKNAVHTQMFDTIGFDRIRDELVSILNEPKPLNAIQRMYEFDELKCIDSSFQGKELKKDLFVRIEDTITWFQLSFLKKPFDRWIIYLMGMVARLSYHDVKRICSSLRIHTRHMKIIYQTFQHFHRIVHVLNRTMKKNSFLYRLLHDVPIEGLLYLMAYSNKEKVKENISYYLTHLADVVVSVNGNDIKSLGLPPSHYYKKILFFILMEKLDGTLKTRKDELQSLNKWVDAYKKKVIISG